MSRHALIFLLLIVYLNACCYGAPTAASVSKISSLQAADAIKDVATSASFGDLPPASVSRFVPETSGSWRGNDALRFSSTYAQGTTVRGFLCSDYVEVRLGYEYAFYACLHPIPANLLAWQSNTWCELHAAA
mmetsp:Transcript_2198/g.5791  ORF Transcript_2198/g.5791 Transcript_2198/m.5791 type:complete len:132 (-) Transcript_2198:1445-1840(-)